MKTTSCLTISQVEKLQQEYKLQNISLLSDLKDIANLNEFIQKIPSLQELEKDKRRFKEFKDSLEDAAKLKARYYTLLKTGRDPKDTIKGYTWSDLNSVSNALSSGMISLFNIKNLSNLLEKNSELTQFFVKFLKTTNEDGKFVNSPAGNQLKYLQEEFKNSKIPYNDLKDEDTFSFYVGDVVPFFKEFLARYYDSYYKENIFEPNFQEAKKTHGDRSVEELIKLDPRFGDISKDKDMLVGTVLALNDFMEKMAKLPKENFQENVRNIEEFKLVEKLIDTFELKDPAFSNLFEEGEANEEDEEMQATDENVTRSFDSSGNEKSGFEAASSDTRGVLGSLFNIENNKLVTDSFGMPTLVNGFKAYKQLSQLLRGIFDYTEFYNKLADAKSLKSYPYIQQLLDNHLMDPNDKEAIERFFNLEKFARNRKQRIKQCLLQDLSKAEVKAKEITLEADRKGKLTETQVLSINDAKLKKAASIFSDTMGRFYNAYRTKNEYLRQPMLNNEGYVRLRSFYAASQIFNRIAPLLKNKKNVDLKDMLNVLAVFGIIPSPNVRKGIVENMLKQHLTTISSFFNKFDFNGNVGKAIKNVSTQNVENIGRNLNLTLNTVMSEFKKLPATKENIEALRFALLGDEEIVEGKKPNTGEKDRILRLIKVDGIRDKAFERLIKQYLKSVVKSIKESSSEIGTRQDVIKALTKEFQVELTDLYDSFVTGELEAELKAAFLEKVSTVSNPIIDLNNGVTGLSNLYSSFAIIENVYNIQYNDDMIIDYEGKLRSQIQQTNNLILKSKDLNSSEARQIFNRFPELDPRRNPAITGSLIFKQLFDIDANGNITRSNSSSQIEINSILGVTTKGKHLQVLKAGITKLNLGDNELASIFSLLFNGNEESFNVDKNSVFNIRFSRFDRSYLGEGFKENTKITDEFLPVAASVISNLYKKEYSDFVSEKKQTQMQNIKLNENAVQEGRVEPIANIFANYLTSYLLMYYEIESKNGNMNYVKNNYENMGKKYQDLGIFEKDSSKPNSNNDYIISKALKDKLKQRVLSLNFTKDTTLQEKNNAINEIVKNTNYEEFQSTLLQFFNSQVEKIFNDIPYTKNIGELENLIGLFSKKNSEGGQILPYYNAFTTDLATKDKRDKNPNIKDKDIKLNYADMLKGLLMTYVVNSNILIQEKMTLFFGESMFVKDYAKRASSAAGTGNYNLIDDIDIQIYNDPRNTQSFAFAKALNKKLISENKPGLDMNLHKLDYTFRFGQVEDNYVFSKSVYDNLKTGFIESFKEKFKSKYSTEAELNKVAEAEATKSLEAYTDLNEADGFGVITFDWYRILSKQTKTWSDEQEKLYLEIIEGGNVSPAVMAVTFPVRKFSYIGSVFLKDTHLPADATHKYSLAPLIPGSGDNNLKTKHENLVKEGKVYEIFKSASKRETVSTNINVNGKIKDTFYDNSKERIIKPLEANSDGKYLSGKDTIFGMTMLLKDQVHVDQEIKTKVILARQLKRIIKTDLYNGGIPTDYKGAKKWEELSEVEQREASNIHAIYRGVMDSIREINTQELQNILEELGIKATKDKKGNLKYEITDTKKVLRTLSKEIELRVKQQKAGAESITTSLLKSESRNPESDIEAFVNLSSLKMVFKNILDRNIRLRKFNGSNLVQSPITGNEPIEIGNKNIFQDQNGYLKFYQGGKGKTSKAEIMITFSEKWKHLLDLEFDGETIDDLDTLNKALLNEEWRKLHEDKLSVLAVRVPIQDPNSIEAFIIKQFLPKSAGSKIVVPSEIVAKSGGDFDIDKLMVYFYNVDSEGNVPFDDSLTGHENKIIQGYFDLLLLPEMFYKLITANSVTALKKKEEKDVDKISDYLSKAMGEDPLKYDGTDLRTPRFNAVQKTNLQEAKKLLGHAASNRAFFEELKHADFKTSPTVNFKVFKNLTYYESETVKQLGLNISVNKEDAVKKVASPIRFPFLMNDGSLAYNVVDVIDENGKEGKGISLSQIFNKKGTQISELISATMNGFVDVGKDPWITALKMNSKITSLNYMMAEGGVPEDMIYLFNNQKIVRDFILNQIALEESPFKRLLNTNRATYNSRVLIDTVNTILGSMQTNQVAAENKETEENKETNVKKKKEVTFRKELTKETKDKLKKALKYANLSSPELVNYIDLYDYNPKLQDQRKGAEISLRLELEGSLLDNFANLKQENFLKEDNLKEGLNKEYSQMTAEELGNQFKLLSFLPFLQTYSGNLVNLMQAEDFDRAKSQYIASEYKNQQSIRKIKTEGYFPKQAMKNFENLNVSADYNISKLTMDVAAKIFPITESKLINKYAIKVESAFDKYIVKEKKDEFINAFKSDFINFVVQNYGTVKTEDGENKNIIEYLVDESVFVNRNVGKKKFTSDTLDKQAVSTKLYTLISNFPLFKSLEVFNYLITTQVRKKTEDSDDDSEFVYKLGRMFKNLNPVELNGFNRDTEIFAKLPIRLNDVLDALETSEGQALDDFDINLTVKTGEEEVTKTIEEIIEELNTIKDNTGRPDFLKIPLKEMTPETAIIVKRLLDKSVEIKDFVAKVLPYISIVQSSSSYSTNYISNLFVRKNYNIILNSIKNFKKKEEGGVTKELLNEYLVQFILNNMTYMRKDKELDVLRLIAGEVFNKETGKREPAKFASNKAITTSNYFNNYYKKEYSLFDENNFQNAPLLSDVVLENEDRKGFFSDIMLTKADKAQEELDDFDDLMDIGGNVALEEDEDGITLGRFKLKEFGTFQINEDSEVFTSKGEKVTDQQLKNRVLVNYNSKLGNLKMVQYKNKPHFVVVNTIINSKFETIENPEGFVDLLLAALPHKLNCK